MIQSLALLRFNWNVLCMVISLHQLLTAHGSWELKCCTNLSSFAQNIHSQRDLTSHRISEHFVHFFRTWFHTCSCMPTQKTRSIVLGTFTVDYKGHHLCMHICICVYSYGEIDICMRAYLCAYVHAWISGAYCIPKTIAPSHTFYTKRCVHVHTYAHIYMYFSYISHICKWQWMHGRVHASYTHICVCTYLL